MNGSFDGLALKPGAQWLDGAWSKRLIAALKEDRAVPGTGLQELQTPSGRLIYLDRGTLGGVRTCIGGVAHNVRFGSIVPHPDDDGHVTPFPERAKICAHIPTQSASLGALAAGSQSFMVAEDEDRIMEFVWRLRRWNFYGTLDLKPVLSPFIAVWNQPSPFYIENGSINDPIVGGPVDAFTNLDDVLCNWRGTIYYHQGSSTVSPDIDLRWGPLVNYGTDHNPATGGVFDSELWFQFSTGDNTHYLGTRSGRPFEFGRLSNDATAVLIYDRFGQNITVPLYYDNLGDTEDWTGTIYLEPGGDFFPWTIDGDDTWDTGDGTQLKDPLRNDADGFPAAYFAQPD